MTPKWLEWVTQLQAIAQNGLTYSTNPFDIDRYHILRRLAAEIGATYSGQDMEMIHNLYSSEIGYATPKVDVRAAIFKDDQILLVSETLDHGRWTLPGGWADVNEPPSLAAEREVREETGYLAKATRLLALYDRETHGHVPHYPHTVYKVFFLCELVGGQPAASIETGESRFYSAAGLPELSTSRVTQQEILRFFELYHHPEWPTDFD